MSYHIAFPSNLSFQKTFLLFFLLPEIVFIINIRTTARFVGKFYIVLSVSDTAKDKANRQSGECPVKYKMTFFNTENEMRKFCSFKCM